MNGPNGIPAIWTIGITAKIIMIANPINTPLNIYETLCPCHMKVIRNLTLFIPDTHYRLATRTPHSNSTTRHSTQSQSILPFPADQNSGSDSRRPGPPPAGRRTRPPGAPRRCRCRRSSCAAGWAWRDMSAGGAAEVALEHTFGRKTPDFGAAFRPAEK